MTQGLSTITDRYDYDAWGNEYPIMVSTLDNPYRYVGQLGYYTHWMDSSLTDLLHLGVRFYEPGAGRFGQRDKDPDEEVSPYCYIGASPVLSADPTGYKDRRKHPVWLYVDDECRQLEDRLKKILSKAVKYQPEKDDEPVRDIDVEKKRNGPLDFVYWQDAEEHKLHGVKVRNGTGKVQVHCKRCRKANEKFFWVDIDAIPVFGARKVKVPEGLDWPWPVKE